MSTAKANPRTNVTRAGSGVTRTLAGPAPERKRTEVGGVAELLRRGRPGLSTLSPLPVTTDIAVARASLHVIGGLDMLSRFRSATVRPDGSPCPSPPAAAGLLLLLALLAPSPALTQDAPMIRLPGADADGGMPLTTTLANRRSVREFTGAPVRLADLAQLLWAAQGVTQAEPAPAGWKWGEWQGGLRAAPSAGALYPLELYVSAKEVDDLEPGLYRYRPREHALVRVGDCGPAELAGAALGQRSVTQAAAVVVVAAVTGRTALKYGDRATRYVHMEAGAAAENLLLQATALSLGAVYTGAFDDDAVRAVLRLPEEQVPLVLLPIGHRPE